MNSRLTGLIAPTLLTLAALAVLISLGNWQMRRLAWKEDLIARATERPNGPVEALPPASAWGALQLAAAEYRPFRLTGRFLYDRQALVFTSLSDQKGRYSGPGYWVVTPFALSAGGAVLVNRGFVPQGREGEAAQAGAPGAETTVVGLMRPDDTPNMFTPANRPDRNMFFTRNIAAIAAAKRLAPPVAPFGIDLVAAETPPAGLPQAGETRMVFANDHLQYAITWYGLAAALAGIYAAFAWTRLRGLPGGPTSLTAPGRAP